MERELGTKIWQLFDNFFRNKRKNMRLPELTEVETRILFMVHGHHKKMNSPINVKFIKDHLRVSSPTVSQIVNDLESKELIYKEPDEVDKRITRLHISEKGIKKLDIAFATFQEQFISLSEYLGRDKSKKLIELLEEVNEYFDKE